MGFSRLHRALVRVLYGEREKAYVVGVYRGVFLFQDNTEDTEIPIHSSRHAFLNRYSVNQLMYPPYQLIDSGLFKLRAPVALLFLSCRITLLTSSRLEVGISAPSLLIGFDAFSAVYLVTDWLTIKILFVLIKISVPRFKLMS